MTENIDSKTLLSSGTHRWHWGDKQRASKQLGTVGAAGVYSYVVAIAGRPGRILGTLAVTAANVDACDAAMDVLEAAIEAYCDSGDAVAWEDPEGHSGANLVLRSYRRTGGRTYGTDGLSCWQRYAIEIYENLGAR